VDRGGAPALGLKPGAFTAAYRRNQDQAVRSALELDAVAAAAFAYMQNKAEVEIGATPLHAALEVIARKQHAGRLPIDWPSMAHNFSGRLRRLAPMLRRVGIEVAHRHGMSGSMIRLANLEMFSRASMTSRENSASSASSDAGNSGPHDAHDAHDAENSQAAEAGRETPPGNGQAAACAICGQPLTEPIVKAPEGLAHFVCVAKPADPQPPKKSRIRRGKRA
jgi:hypothetical protein